MSEPPRCSNQKFRIPVTTVKPTQPTIGRFDNAAIRPSINAVIQPSRGSDVAETNVKPSQVSESLSPLASHENGVLNPGRTTFSTIFLPKTHASGTSSSPAPFTSIIDLSPSQGTGKIALQITSTLRGSSTGGIQFPTVAPSSVANSIGSTGGLAATILAPSGAGIIPSLTSTSGLLETIATSILTSESEPNHAQASLELPPISQPTPGIIVGLTTAFGLTDSPMAECVPDGGGPTQLFDLLNTATNKYGIEGTIYKDMNINRKVKLTSAGIATGATMSAIAYGAAMFLVARMYMNKKHQRSNLVSSTSRYTYGSMAGGATWMPSGRPGQSSPGGRDTCGSRGSGGRAIR